MRMMFLLSSTIHEQSSSSPCDLFYYCCNMGVLFCNALYRSYTHLFFKCLPHLIVCSRLIPAIIHLTRSHQKQEKSLIEKTRKNTNLKNYLSTYFQRCKTPCFPTAAVNADSSDDRFTSLSKVTVCFPLSPFGLLPYSEPLLLSLFGQSTELCSSLQ